MIQASSAIDSTNFEFLLEEGRILVTNRGTSVLSWLLLSLLSLVRRIFVEITITIDFVCGILLWSNSSLSFRYQTTPR